MSESTSRYSRRYLLRVAAVTPLGAALLAACGGSGAASSSSTAASSAPATVASSSAAKATSASASSTQAAAPANAPQPTPTPAAGETHKGAATTIDLWYGWGGATEIKTWEALGKQMGQALTGFNVHWITANNNTKLLTAIAGGSPPNVAVGNAPYPEFWARGAALPLDAMLAKSTAVTKTDIPASSWSYASYKGKTFGVPAIEAFVRYALCMDATNLKNVGIDPKTVSWDWETLTQLQQQLTKKAPNGSISVLGIDPLDSMGGTMSGGNPFFWADSWGIQYFDEPTGKFNFANDQLAEAMATIKKLYDIAGGAQTVSGFHNSYGTWATNPTSAFPSGVEDMQIDGYWDAGWVAHDATSREFAYTWAPVPTSRKGVMFQSTGGHSAFLPKGSKNADQSFQLIEFLVGDTAATAIFDGSGFLGARKSFLGKLSQAQIAKYPGLDWFINSYTHNDKLYSIPSNPVESFTATQWNTALQNVLYGKAQPKDALAQLQQIVTNQLQQQFPNG